MCDREVVELVRCWPGQQRARNVPLKLVFENSEEKLSESDKKISSKWFLKVESA
jgi:hypothetical protein